MDRFISILSFSFVVWASLFSQVAAAENPPASVREQLGALRAAVARHDQLYHRHGAPEISDADYDRLKQKLRALERAHPELASASAGVPDVADDRSGLFQTVRHRVPLLSLDKAYDESELREFYGRVAKSVPATELAFVVEPKFDGLAVSATFEQGEFVRAVTRGNGLEGDDITANVRQIAGWPRSLVRRTQGGVAVSVPGVIELRGEIYVASADFARLNAEREAAGERPFANARNLAAGTVRQRDPAEVRRRNLRVVFYGYGAVEPVAALPATQREFHARLKSWGVPTIERVGFARDANALVRAVTELGQARSSLDYPTDGAVVKLDSLAQQAELGASENAPRGAVAYKFAPERAATQVRAIVVQVGRSGVLTPVAELDPVALAGSTVARATLHNREEIARKDVRVGDTVWVEKAGEIIPAIAAVDLSRRSVASAPFVFPKHCPACGRGASASSDEVAVRCGNESCGGRLRRRIEYFASPACMDIPGLGPATAELLVERGLVRDLGDLYRLQRTQWAALPGCGEAVADRLLAGLAASKRVELARVIQALSIPQIGASAAREVAMRVGSLEALLAFADGGGTAEREDKGAALRGSFEANAPLRRVAAYLKSPRARAELAALIAAGVQPTPPPLAREKAALVGKVFVLTGTLPTMTRLQAAAEIEAAGATVASSVSRTTHFLVVGADPGVKLTQARALGVAVIDETELRRMLREE